MTTTRWMAMGLVGALCACSSSKSNGDEFGTSLTDATSAGGGSLDTGNPGDGDGDGDSDATDASGDAGEETSEGGGTKLDVGPGGDGDGDVGCQKVDFLFIVDSSGSMSEHQDKLVAVFPGFLDAIEGTLDEAQDYHVMVVDSDADGAAVCQWWCDLGTPFCSGYTCGDNTNVWGACDRALGAGVVHPMGIDASSQACGFPEGQRWIAGDDPLLDERFACAAQVGASMDDEWQFDAIEAALSPDLVAGCNAGFLREDAILVVTLITDEDDLNSAATAAQARDSLVAAKNGDDTAIVMLGILSDVDLPNAVCVNMDGFPTAAPGVQSFVSGFPNSSTLSVCEDEAGYADFFQAAVSTVADTCEAFDPVG